MMNHLQLQRSSLAFSGRVHTCWFRHWYEGHDQAETNIFCQFFAIWSTADQQELLLAPVNCYPFLFMRQEQSTGYHGMRSWPFPFMNKTRSTSRWQKSKFITSLTSIFSHLAKFLQPTVLEKVFFTFSRWAATSSLGFK